VTITLGTSRLPSFEAFKDVFWMAALASSASIAAAVFIPRAAAAAEAAIPAPAATELVVQGRVLTADHRPLTPAVVTVLQTTGEPVDWSRVDSDGNYSVALPGAGKYLMVANAAGWAPMAEVFDFDGRTLQQNFHLGNRLELGGVASMDGAALEGAVVTLLQASGEYVATTRTDHLGRYSLPLPLHGRYIVTMLHPLTHQAMARKLAVDNRSVTADLALDTPAGQLVEA
jgi:hypothetical protein